MKNFITDFAYYLILGRPVIFYLGLLTFICLLTAGTVGYFVHKGKIKFIYHKIFASTSLFLACVHAIIGIIIYI